MGDPFRSQKYVFLDLSYFILLAILVSFTSAQNFEWPSVTDFIQTLTHYGVKPPTADQVHLAFGAKSSSEISVSWVTEEESDSIVFYGSEPTELDRSAHGESSKYSFKSFYYGGYESGFIHHVTLTELKPNTRYFYHIGGNEFTLTNVFDTFVTPHSVGTDKEFSFGVIGDLGQTTNSEITLKHMLSDHSLGFVIHAGDLAYADCYQPRWDSYQEMITPLARKLPWMVVPGNHEIEYDSISNTTFVAYEARYKMPQVKPMEFDGFQPNNLMDYFNCQPSEFSGSYDFGNSFYSFDIGTVHFIMLNTYTRTHKDSKQYKWLKSDLQKLDRKTIPWIIVVMHAPWYNSNVYHQNETEPLQMQETMESLLNKHRVNLVISGHVHAYERTYPVIEGKRDSTGITFITVGDGGNREGHANLWIENIPSWSAFRNGDTFGYGKITVKNNTHLLWEWKMNTGGENHDVGDAVYVTQNDNSTNEFRDEFLRSEGITEASLESIAQS